MLLRSPPTAPDDRAGARTPFEIRRRIDRLDRAVLVAGLGLATVSLAVAASTSTLSAWTAGVALPAAGVLLARRAGWAGIALAATGSLVMMSSAGPAMLWAVAALALFRFCLHRPPGAGLVALLALAGAAAAVAASRQDGSGLSILLSLIALYGCAAGTASAVRADSIVRATAIERDALVARQAASDERMAIARDIHDGVAQHVAAIGILANLAGATLHEGSSRAPAALSQLRDEVKLMLRELEDSVGALRDGERPDDTVVDRVHAHVALLRARGADVAASLEPAPPTWSAEQRTAVFRAAQEALTNAWKHGAGAISIVGGPRVDGYRIAVANRVPNGTSRSGNGSGEGLPGMRERVRSAGGTLRLDAEEGTYRVTVLMPSGQP